MVYIHCGEMETTHDNNHNGNGASNSGGVVGYVDATSANGGVGSSDGDGGLSEISCNDIEAIGDGGDTSKNGPMGAKSPCLVANRTGGGICDKATNHGASPFLTKLYLMVDDKATNSIISWGSLGTTFIITDKQELISKILPCYFKTDRFENFISQLNTYGFKKKEWHQLEFEHEYFQKGKIEWLNTIKSEKQQSNVINKPCVQVNELKATFVKVRQGQTQISNKIKRFKYDVEQTLLDIQTITKSMTNKLLSTFSAGIGRKRTFLDIDHMINFVDIEKYFQSIIDPYMGSWSNVDCLMTLSDLNEKGNTEYGEGARRGGVNGYCVKEFLHKLYNMVEKEEINDLIFWNRRCDGFVISDINKFATDVLPMYFKHKNFGSFNSQLNVYGFKKVSWEIHEYANEWFRKGKYDLLANIRRRDKTPRLVKFGKTCSKIEVEVFNNRLKTILHNQDSKIILLSNYEEQIKSSVHEFKEVIVNMANVVDELTEKSSERLENIKKSKLEFEQDVTGNVKEQDQPEVNELETAPRENHSPEVQDYSTYFQESEIEELGFDRWDFEKILMEWKSHVLNDTQVRTYNG
ncbi:putative transcription factor HSF-type-DNA-binding family [Helianthus annuus]|nr:putative transcription factor HSF-type-DNA-binding family [Helianthus annuus]